MTYSTAHSTERNFRPVRVVDVELTDPPAPIRNVGGYGLVRCLVRRHGRPVGDVTIPVTGDDIPADVVRHAIVEQLGRTITNHHLYDLLAQPSEAWRTSNLPQAAPTSTVSTLPFVTVAVCTRDRPEDLAQCLAAIRHLRYDHLEVIVVDNAPTTDATERLVREQYPDVRYVREERPGLNWARNRAALEARGDVIAYTDDDVIVDPLWAHAVGHVFAENPGVMAVTGLVVPHELETPAQVLFETYGGFGRGYERRWYGVDTEGGEGAALSMAGAGKFGTGANMAYRRELFDRIGYFDPALDVGTVTNGGGDLEMFFRTLKEGYVLVYEPAAIVRHRHRREDERLRVQIRNNGIGFYAYLVRTALHYPNERLGLARIGAWWFRYWSVTRLLKSFVGRANVPRDLITGELVGSVRGLTRYQRARRAARALARPGDPPSHPTVRVPRNARSGAVAVRVLDLDTGIRGIHDVSVYATTRVVLRAGGRPIGHLHVPNWYGPISAARLRDEIVRHMGAAVLAPEATSEAHDAATHAVRSVIRRYAPGVNSAPREQLPDDVLVSVVIATRDRPDDLRVALRGVTRQCTRRPTEVIVVDNNPASGDTARVIAEFPGVRLVTETRKGLSYARNAGVLAARGDVIAFTDDDVTVPPDWLERLVAPFARPDVAIVTGNVLPVELETRSQQLFELYGGLGRGYHRFEVNGAWFRAFRRKGVPTWHLGATANAAFRASLFHDPRVGLLEESLGAGMPAGVGEDTYLFYRALRAGHTLVYEPAAYVWHKHRRTMRALRQQLFAYSKGHVAYHLLTVLRDRDPRGLLHVTAVMPYWRAKQLLAWTRDALRGRAAYPFSLILLELWGNLLGPVALSQSVRRVRRTGRSAHTTRADAASPAPADRAAMTAPPLGADAALGMQGEGA